MTVRLANRIGMDKILNMASKFNINEGFDDKLSMSLGSGVITLRDLTNAYAIIANGGKKIESKFITSIYNRNGNKIRDTSLKKCNECIIDSIPSKIKIPNLDEEESLVVDPRLAYQITSMMEGVIQRRYSKKIKRFRCPDSW